MGELPRREDGPAPDLEMNVVVHAGALLPVLLYATLDLAARPFSPGSDHQQARVLPCKHTQQPSATRPPNGKRKKAPLGRTATARCHHAVVPNRPRKRLRIHLLHNTQPKGQHQRSMLVCVPQGAARTSGTSTSSSSPLQSAPMVPKPQVKSASSFVTSKQCESPESMWRAPGRSGVIG